VDDRVGEASAVAKILGAAAFWSTIGVASVLGGNYVELAFFRSLVAAAISLAFIRSASKASLAAGLLLGALFTIYPIAAVLAGVGTAAYLLYTAPLWTTLEARAYGERVNKQSAASVALVLAAVALMALSASRGSISVGGLAAGLASGAAYGSYIAAARYYSRLGRDEEVSLGAMPYTLFVSAPAALAYTLAFGAGDLARPALAGLYLGVFATVIPYRLFASGVRAVGASRASVLATIEPALAAVWGYLLFGERPGPLVLAAYGLITAAAALSARPPRGA
jgi:drug/metabolite transporter (DMT)-like permease